MNVMSTLKCKTASQHTTYFQEFPIHLDPLDEGLDSYTSHHHL